MARFTDATKEEARKLLAQCGSLDEVAKQKGMPSLKVLTKWAQEGGWISLVDPNKQLTRSLRRKFKNARQLASEIDLYFDSLLEISMQTQMVDNQIIASPRVDSQGNPIKQLYKAPTITGLCLFLGLTLHNYYQYLKGDYDLDDEKYSEVLEMAKMVIEEFNFQKLYNSDTREGAKFVLERQYKYYQHSINEEIEHVKKLEDFFKE